MVLINGVLCMAGRDSHKGTRLSLLTFTVLIRKGRDSNKALKGILLAR